MKKAKIYTKTGDKGVTSLYGGKRVWKDNIRIEAYGTIDELNSLLGFAVSGHTDKKLKESISNIQKDLFLCGSYLAYAPVDIKSLNAKIEKMEQEIDCLDLKMRPLKNFLLPQGTEISTLINFARTVSRRAERRILTLSRKEKIEAVVLKYFNRLSDMLFILARYLNFQSGVKEKIWEA